MSFVPAGKFRLCTRNERGRGLRAPGQGFDEVDESAFVRLGTHEDDQRRAHELPPVVGEANLHLERSNALAGPETLQDRNRAGVAAVAEHVGDIEQVVQPRADRVTPAAQAGQPAKRIVAGEDDVVGIGRDGGETRLVEEGRDVHRLRALVAAEQGDAAREAEALKRLRTIALPDGALPEAYDAETGAERWHFDIDDPNDVAFGRIVSSAAIAEVGALSERRIALLIDASLSGLPPFLVEHGGVNSGFMVPQVTAAALASENKSLAHPASVDSLPTSANQEDHVSMATFAARRLSAMARNSAGIVAIELLAAAQGIDFRAPLKTSAPLQDVHALVRSRVGFYDHDRYFAPDITAIQALVEAGAFHRYAPGMLFSV